MVLVSSFPNSVNWSKEHIPSILHVSQSSQELGSAVADVVFGKVSPAGRLVQTWITSIDQLPPSLDYNIRNGITYMYSKYPSLFPFGHGLTYTTFRYSGLQLSKKSVSNGETVNVMFSIQNTGYFDSDEVAQLYVSFPGSVVQRPALELKGFKREFIKKGENKVININLKAEDLRYWDEKAGEWVLEKGTIKFFIGSSSVDQRLKGTLTII
jgi:beta-glucosidase